MFLRVQVLQGPGFSGSESRFRVQVPGPGFRSSLVQLEKLNRKQFEIQVLKFQKLRAFVFKRKTFCWQKIDRNKKEQKVDSVKNTDSNSDKIDDGDQQRKVDSIILEERRKIVFFLYFIKLFIKTRNL